MKRRESSRALTEQDFNKIIGLCKELMKKRKGFMYVGEFQQYVFYNMLWYLGTRPRESYGALVSDIDLENKTFFISGERNKQKESATLNIPTPLIPILKEYLDYHKEHFNNSKWLFPSQWKNDKPKYRGTVIRNFSNHLRYLGLNQVRFIDGQGNKKLTYNLYSFRKGHGSFVYMKTGDIILAQKSLRHKDIGTTIKFYIKGVDEFAQKKISAVFEGTFKQDNNQNELIEEIRELRDQNFKLIQRLLEVQV